MHQLYRSVRPRSTEWLGHHKQKQRRQISYVVQQKRCTYRSFTLLPIILHLCLQSMAHDDGGRTCGSLCVCNNFLNACAPVCYIDFFLSQKVTTGRKDGGKNDKKKLCSHIELVLGIEMKRTVKMFVAAVAAAATPTREFNAIQQRYYYFTAKSFFFV